MVSYTLRSILFITLISGSIHLCQASDNIFGDPTDSDAGSEHTLSAQASVTRFVPTPALLNDLPNETFVHKPIAETTPKNPDEEEGFVSVDKQTKISPELSIVGGMFDTLVIPTPTMPYTNITLTGCCCQMPLDPDSFQHNPELTTVSLTNCQLNLRDFEEKFGEGCLNLNCIDLMNTIDSSVVGYLIITPERFAQLAHPDILHRILCGKCEVFISHPSRERDPYTLEEMKEKFLSSILQLRSLNKAKETLSVYGKLIDMLRAGVESIDPKALATAGGRAVFKVYTGM